MVAYPLKALLIEDRALDILILTGMLRMFHCETTVVKNGQEAVDMFLEGKKFDIVLSDNDMPIMSGPEAVANIRAMGETEVMIVGVSSDDDAMEAFMCAGADVFVEKPLKLEILGTVIQQVINKNN